MMSDCDIATVVIFAGLVGGAAGALAGAMMLNLEGAGDKAEQAHSGAQRRARATRAAGIR